MQRRAPLQVEELGARIVPSAVAPSLPVSPAAAAVAAPHHAHHALAGHGQYTADLTPGDTGARYSLQGSADLADLGHVTVSGSVTGVGFVQHGRAGGTLTFANAKGSVAVRLEGPDQPSFSPLPQKFHYRVVGGTRAYKGLHDHGTLTLALKAGPGASGGTFTLTI